MPKSLEMFHQESGRAGRDGQIAYSLLYYTYSDSRHQKWLLNKNQSIGNTALRRNHDNLMSMLSYCENIVDCRRVLLLKHFGEQYNREKCLENEGTTCDNCACKSEVREVDVTLIGKAVVALVSLFDQFKEIGIPPSDINVVTYGSVPIGAHVQFNPVCRTGSAILEDIENRNIEELWLKALALECYARVISTDRIDPDSATVDTIANYKVPTSVEEVRSFLNLPGYYRLFIENFGSITQPLTAKTHKNTLKNPSPGPITTKLLSKNSQKYATIGKEALAFVFSIKHFRQYLLDKPFTVISDHRPFQWLDEQKDNNGRFSGVSVKIVVLPDLLFFLGRGAIGVFWHTCVSGVIFSRLICDLSAVDDADSSAVVGVTVGNEDGSSVVSASVDDDVLCSSNGSIASSGTILNRCCNIK
ncbi:Bloom Syndrome-like protein [Daphnia magna]|uniref:Bloom Syndrome-like protein n=1 Tax=Daphnia magna TaxID=35525 RepID=A0A164N3M1_9CRUS|nr:Bloom Syndrome-like protein [Daphnia magna]